MSDSFLQVNGIRCNTASLRVPFSGRWVLDVEYDGNDVLAGAATAKIGDTSLVGTVHPVYSGTFNHRVLLRVVAGANKWQNKIPGRSFHNDAGVKRASVVKAIAAAVGEPVDVGADAVSYGSDVMYKEGPGVRALSRVLREGPWRVDFDGVTRYGDRPAAPPKSPLVELMEVDPRTHMMTFGSQSINGLTIGNVVSDARLGAPLTVRELEVSATADQMRIYAWGLP